MFFQTPSIPDALSGVNAEESQPRRQATKAGRRRAFQFLNIANTAYYNKKNKKEFVV
jgi:hypothetical protein